MIILIGGSSHVGKTYLAQKLMEKAAQNPDDLKLQAKSIKAQMAAQKAVEKAQKAAKKLK